jgi:hypothetical protein
MATTATTADRALAQTMPRLGSVAPTELADRPILPAVILGR